MLRFYALFIALFVSTAAYAGDAGTPDAGTVVASAPVASPDSDLAGYAKSIYTAVTSSNWRMVAALVLIGVVWALRKWAPASWMKTDRGGAALALIVGVAGAMSTALLASKSLANALVDGLVVGVTGAGGFAVLKKIISPGDTPKPIELPKT